MKFLPYGSPIPLEILRGSPERGRQTRVGWENRLFSKLSVILQTVEDTFKVTISD